MDRFNFDFVCEQLKSAGVVRTEEEFSLLLGKGRSYISSLKCKPHSDLSLDGLCHLAFNIEDDLRKLEAAFLEEDSTSDILNQCRILHHLKNDLFELIRNKVKSVRE